MTSLGVGGVVIKNRLGCCMSLSLKVVRGLRLTWLLSSYTAGKRYYGGIVLSVVSLERGLALLVHN